MLEILRGEIEEIGYIYMILWDFFYILKKNPYLIFHLTQFDLNISSSIHLPKKQQQNRNKSSQKIYKKKKKLINFFIQRMLQLPWNCTLRRRQIPLNIKNKQRIPKRNNRHKLQQRNSLCSLRSRKGDDMLFFGLRS